jgi:hypothetical protein
MNDDKAPPRAAIESGFAWLAEGSMPQSREDRVAEVVALIALVFSLGVGVLIAMLPTSSPAAAPIGKPSWKAAPARDRASRQFTAIAAASLDDALADGRCLEHGVPRPCLAKR